MNKEDVTVEEIQSIFLAQFYANGLKHLELSRRIQIAIDSKTQEEGPILKVIKENFFNNVSALFASRLKKDDHEIPLVSNEDSLSLISSSMEEFILQMEDGTPEEEQAFIESIMNAFVVTIFPVMSEMIPMMSEIIPSFGDNLYEKNWTRIIMVLDIAKERKLSLDNLFVLEHWTDELVRRSSTRDEQLSSLQKMLECFSDEEKRKKIISEIVPTMIESPELDKEIEEDFEREIIPESQKIRKIRQTIVKDWAEEEIERIFPSVG